jgi:hypothetical protein
MNDSGRDLLGPLDSGARVVPARTCPKPPFIQPHNINQDLPPTIDDIHAWHRHNPNCRSARTSTGSVDNCSCLEDAAGKDDFFILGDDEAVAINYGI